MFSLCVCLILSGNSAVSDSIILTNGLFFLNEDRKCLPMIRRDSSIETP
ncbi:hypothetical protein MCHI_001568 [Candidatus Magnetoovum chiemensis]|nr:hypothetical protein MCHI_001568 [Candidatus Magnetoovum chiemensis]